MCSYELMELFGASIEQSIIVDGSSFGIDAMIVTNCGLSSISIVSSAKKKRVIRFDFAPDDGELAKVLRGGERVEWQQMLAQSANTAAIFRASKLPDADADVYGERLFMPIKKIMDIDDEQDRIPVEPDVDPGGLYSLWQAV